MRAAAPHQPLSGGKGFGVRDSEISLFLKKQTFSTTETLYSVINIIIIYSRPLCKAKASTLFSQGRNCQRRPAAGRSLGRHIAAGDFMANKKLYKKERFSGCIVGAAAGDALGSPVKTLTRSQIKDLYGKKGILKLSPE